MGIDIKPGAPPLKPGDATCRYAQTMEWLAAPAKAMAAASGKVAKRA